MGRGTTRANVRPGMTGPPGTIVKPAPSWGCQRRSEAASRRKAAWSKAHRSISQRSCRYPGGITPAVAPASRYVRSHAACSRTRSSRAPSGGGTSENIAPLSGLPGDRAQAACEPKPAGLGRVAELKGDGCFPGCIQTRYVSRTVNVCPPSRERTMAKRVKVTVNLTDDDLTELRGQAERDGITVTDAIRRSIAIGKLVTTATRNGEKVLIRGDDGDTRQIELMR